MMRRPQRSTLFPYTTLFRSKIASDLKKPNGQYEVAPENVPEFMAALSVRRIPGIGQVTGILRTESADRKSTRLNSSHTVISYAVFCLKKKKKTEKIKET